MRFYFSLDMGGLSMLIVHLINHHLSCAIRSSFTRINSKPHRFFHGLLLHMLRGASRT